MAESVQWSLLISKETDDALRSYLAQHDIPDEELPKFVEDAVRWRVLEKTVDEVKARNAGSSREEIEDAIEDALRSVRAERFAK